MKVPFVDLKAQYTSIQSELDEVVLGVMSRCDFILGKEVDAFEKAFAEYVGVKHVVGVSSGTSALRLAIEALGIGAGDEVVTTANTYIATCEAISHAGATVRLVDCDPDTYNIDVSQLEDAVKASHGKVKGVIPVHLYGQPADMEPVQEIAHRHHLFVIEDVAQAHGALYRGRKTGTFGDAAAFSFYPGKNLGAYGDGGAVATNDDAVAGCLKSKRNHGQKIKYEHLEIGYCDRLDTLQAAVLLKKLPHIDHWNQSRQKAAELYRQELADIHAVAVPFVPADRTSAYHLYEIRVQDGRRDELFKHLQDSGVSVGLHYPIPNHLQKAYSCLGHKAGDFPVSERLAKQLISLPMYPELSAGQIHYVADTIRSFFHAN
jgi:dTDP-3-amino-3,4,6-trideoxy-alpha-D-glucose transaminase